MALNTAAAAVGLLFAAGAVSLVAVGTVNLIKEIKAEKQWTAIEAKLEDVKNSSGMSSLEESISQNKEKNKKDQKDQKEKIELINTEEQLKKDIKALQAQIEQAQKDLGTAKTQKTKLEKAIHTLTEMRRDLEAALAAVQENADATPHLDGMLWNGFFNNGAGGGVRYNAGGAATWNANKATVLDLCAGIDGARDGSQVAGNHHLMLVLNLLADRQADNTGEAGVLATGAHRGPALAFLNNTFRPELKAQVDNIKKFKKAIAKHNADLKTKEKELAVLQKKNK